MIIRIEKSGGSFRGAGQYYLHDKLPEAERGKNVAKELMPTTDERVWFTDTRNCANLDSEKALDEMWHVAEIQQWLKAQVGGRTSGRVCSEPVKTISIAWAKEDAPTPDHMVEAADAFLKHMGWDRHQAVYVGHRDTEHRHIHIILNRVDHETGRTLDDGFEWRRSQAFALSYEKEMGKLWCVEREINAAEREKREPELAMAVRQPEPEREPSPERKPANQHIPHNVIAIMRPSERAFDAEEKVRHDQFAAERADLKVQQRAEREAWFKEGKDLFRQLRHDVYDAVRAEHRAAWRQYYADEKAGVREADDISSDGLRRAHFFARDGDWEKAHTALHDCTTVRDEIAYRLYDQHAAIKEAQTNDLRTRQKEACDALLLERKEQYAELLARQREERAAMRAAHVQGQSADFVLEERSAAVEQRLQANDNRQPQVIVPETVPQHQLFAEKVLGAVEAMAPSLTEAVQNERSTALTEPRPPVEQNPAPQPIKSAADLAAGGIGAAADYVAEQMAEFLAPTPPEVREARAKEEAKREAERPRREDSELWSPYVEAAVRAAERAQEDKRSRDYWEDRHRNKDWERDR